MSDDIIEQQAQAFRLIMRALTEAGFADNEHISGADTVDLIDDGPSLDEKVHGLCIILKRRHRREMQERHVTVWGGPHMYQENMDTALRELWSSVGWPNSLFPVRAKRWGEKDAAQAYFKSGGVGM